MDYLKAYVLFFLHLRVCSHLWKIQDTETIIRFNHVVTSGTCLKSIPSVSYSDCFGQFESYNNSFNYMVYRRQFLLCKLCFVCKMPTPQKEPGHILVHYPFTDTALVNLARGKPTDQSSTLGHAYSSLAVDGMWESDMWFSNTNSFTCAHTKSDNEKMWWMVNLEHIYVVSKVVILNRIDCCWERLRDLTITVGETESNMLLCATYEGAGELVNITCQTSLSGQFVRINKPGPDALQLCEVGVYC